MKLFKWIGLLRPLLKIIGVKDKTVVGKIGEGTEAVVDELKKETKVVELNGERPIEEIQKDLVKEIDSLKK